VRAALTPSSKQYQRIHMRANGTLVLEEPGGAGTPGGPTGPA